MSPDERSWLSAHVYHGDTIYGRTGDTLLLEAVAPWVDEERAHGRLEKFFFVRYADPDAHVRMRFLGRSAEAAGLKQSFEEKCLGPFNVCRSSRALVPVRSVWARYEPEIDRYGGNRGISIAEDVFDRSSAVVIAALKDFEGAEKVGLAMILTSLMANALVTRDLASRLFRTQSGAFARRAARVLSLKADELTLRWEKAYAEQDAKIERLAQVADSLSLEGGSDPYGAFNRSLRSARSQYELLLTHSINHSVERSHERGHMAIAASLIHMTCNRVGVSIADEGCINYLLWRRLGG